MITNIEAAKTLADRYDAITLEEIEQTRKEILAQYAKRGTCINFAPYYRVIATLTGFGGKFSCPLCAATTSKDKYGFRTNCNKCIYVETIETAQGIDSYCCSGINEGTYFAINSASDAVALLTAIRERAGHIRRILDGISTGGK